MAATSTSKTRGKTKALGFPTLDHERSFLAPGVRLLAGVDEVGRGALAGPVSVGIAVVNLEDHSLLADVRDSKLLKPEDRERLEPMVRQWAVASAVGHATSGEIDRIGIIAALRLAGTRAWLDILAGGTRPDVVLLDGSHNWLSPEVQASLFDTAPVVPSCDAPVHTKVKADMTCLSVAAARVLAKVARTGSWWICMTGTRPTGGMRTRGTPRPRTGMSSGSKDPASTTGPVGISRVPPSPDCRVR